MSSKSFDGPEKEILPFNKGLKEIAETLSKAWSDELSEGVRNWICSRKEAHQDFGTLKGTEALARVALKDNASNIYDEIYAET